MILEAVPEVDAVFRAAARRPLLAAAERRRGPSLDTRGVKALLPHRDPILLVDRITRVDRMPSLIVCRCDTGRAARILAGHFPAEPVWPGVLQVEAIGQAGWCLIRLLEDGAAGAGDPASPRSRPPTEPARGFVLTHILAAQFVRPVRPGGELEIVARAFPDGLFTVLVGQCLLDDAVCSAAAVRGLNKEARV